MIASLVSDDRGYWYIEVWNYRTGATVEQSPNYPARLSALNWKMNYYPNTELREGK